MISSLWPPAVLGGAELHAARLADELRGAGHEVGVVTLGVEGPDVVATATPWPYPVQDYAAQPAWRRAAFHARDQYDPTTARLVRRAAESFRPDVVHSHSVPGLSVSALTAPARAGIAHVHTLHDYWLLCQRATMVDRADRACESRCASCRAISGVRAAILRRHAPQVVTAVSEAVADEHRRAGVLADRLRVVRNPVEAPAAAGPRRAPAAPVTFGFIGRLVPIKGVRTLLAALAMLPAGTARLVVAGRGPLEDEVLAADGVEAIGWVEGDRKERFLAEVDCLVVPSEWKDPAPLVLNEARARGIPVIGAAIGGIGELVAPACAPLLFESGDAADLAASLRSFALDPAAFVPGPGTAPPGWPEHLAEVERAYDDARSALRAG